MTNTATFFEFKKRFGTNEGRLVLLDALGEFLITLQENFTNFRILVYGSFISDKAEPNDIDVMVHVSSKPTDHGFNKFKKVEKLSAPSIDVFTLNLSYSFDPLQVPPDAKSMLKQFNDLEAQVLQGIKCDHAIELLLQ